MAIGFRTTTVTSGNQTTGFSLVINSAVVANDLLILCVTNRDATANPTVVDNDTGGNTWAIIGNQNAATNGAGTVWWKRATSATASKTITVSGCTGSASGCLVPVTGASLGTVPYGTAVGESNASGNTTQVGITVGRAGSHVCLSVHCTSNDTLNPDVFTATSPTTLTERAEGLSSGGSDCSTSFATGEKTAAGATGNISWTQTAGTGASIAFELKAAYSPLVCVGGTFNISGTDATLKYNRILSAAPGSFAITGTDATLTHGTVGGAVIELLDFTINGGTNNTVTTATIETTTATLIVISVSTYQGTTFPAVTDSEGNTWTQLTTRTSSALSNYKTCLFYCASPDTSAGHSFSATATTSYPTIAVLAFKGTHATPFDQENGGTNGSAATVQPGSITPSINNCLVVSGVAHEHSNAVISGGTPAFTGIDIDSSGGNYIGGGIAYQIQTTATAVNPTWTMAGASPTAASIASFKAGVAGPASFSLNCIGGAFTISGPDATLTHSAAPGGGGGAIEFIASTIDGDTVNDVTSDAINTTDATLIVISVSTYQGTTFPAVTDSKGNAWNPLTTRSSTGTTNYKTRLFWCASPATDVSHTFSAAASTSYPTIAVLAFKGTHTTPFDQENGSASGTSTTVQPGSITPSEANCVVVTGLEHDNANAVISGGFTAIDIDNAGGTYVGGGIAYQIQTTATAVNPTWTVDGTTNIAASIASFKAGGGGGGGSDPVNPFSSSIPGSGTDPMRGM